MIPKPVLATILQDQSKEQELPDASIPRSLLPKAEAFEGTSAFVIKGLRRCGKSTLMKQIIQARFESDHFYFNFDDERVIGFVASDFQTLMEAAIEAHGEKNNLFFDEIQNVKGWELFVNRMLREGHRVFITGSNAHLLSKELGTHLTGRHTDVELYPFSFREYLRAKETKAADVDPAHLSTMQRAELNRQFKKYLLEGGMPEAIVFDNEAVLTQVLNDIIQKDIVTRYSLKKPAEFKTAIKFLMDQVAKPFTYRSITPNFNIKSPLTVQRYVEYAEETYLLFTLKRYETKTKLLEKSPKKIYCVDNGIIAKNTPSINEKKGALLENAVAIHLKRLGKEIYYHSTGRTECDFVIPAERTAIQVCYRITPENRERENQGLQDAMKALKTDKGLILTLEDENQMGSDKNKVRVMPAWKWMLMNPSAQNSVQVNSPD